MVEGRDARSSISLSETDELKAVSFLSHYVYASIRVSMSATFAISFKIKTVYRDGLLMYGLTVSASGYLAMELVDGYLRYICDIEGSGSRLLPMKYRFLVSDNNWHEISVLWFRGTEHLLKIDNITVADIPVHSRVHRLRSELHIGGVDSDTYNQLPRKIRSRRGFKGCFSSLVVDGTEHQLLDGTFIRIPDEFKDQIKRGCTDSVSLCLPNSCDNKGDCIQGTELFTCYCDMTSFTGPSCSDESIAYSFGERGGAIFFQYPENARYTTKEDTVAFGLNTLQTDAVLLKITSSSFKDLIEIELRDGFVFAKYYLGYDEHQIGDMINKVNDDIYHVVRFSRLGASAKLQVDDFPVNEYTAEVHQPGGFDRPLQIQVGAAKTGSDEDGGFILPFRGTIVGLVVNSVRILDLTAEGDSRITIEGDVDLDTKPLKLFHSFPQLYLPEFDNFEESTQDLVFVNNTETDEDNEQEEDQNLTEWHGAEASYHDDLIFTGTENSDCHLELSCYDAVEPSDALILPVINKPLITTSETRPLPVPSATSSKVFPTVLQKLSDHKTDANDPIGEFPCDADYAVMCSTSTDSFESLSQLSFTTHRQQIASSSAQNDTSFKSQTLSATDTASTFANVFPVTFNSISKHSAGRSEVRSIHMVDYANTLTIDTELRQATELRNVDLNIGLVSGISISVCILIVVLFYSVCKCCRMRRQSAVLLHESKNYGKGVTDDRKPDETNQLLRTNFTFARQRDVREWYV